MKKKIFLLYSLPLLVAGSFASSCNENNNSSDGDPKNYNYWSTYATDKVIQDATKNKKYTNLGKQISIAMMQNEKETGQLIVSSDKTAKVELVYGDLVNENNQKIAKENVTIYYQKYVKILGNLHGGGFFDPDDCIPDFLLPMDKAIEYNENYVYANCNQGFTVEINSKNIPAGTYKGNFTLKINSIEKTIPVEVEVWDFAYEGKSKIQSCWLTYTSDLFGTEFDSTPEIAEKYMAFTSEYKACPYLIQEAKENDPVKFTEQMKRLFEIENYNTIVIPYDFQLDYKYGTDDKKPAKFIAEIAKASTEEKFYLDYAVFYPSTYDEADIDTSRPKAEACPAFFSEGGEYQKTLDGAIDLLEEEGYFVGKTPEWNERVRNAIHNIPPIFTNVQFMEDWVESYPAVFCPYESLLANTKYREKYLDQSDKVNNQFWTYTCTDPDYPYPSHHIDDNNLSMRVLGWMEKCYNITGYLYYETCLFPGHNPGQYHDQYGSAQRYIGCNGDGFILYPGNYYGSDTPYPSNRLITYRDGLEDFDMLTIYEDLLNEYADLYGIEDFKASDYINDLYDSLFYNAVNFEDHSLLFKARKELANRILELKNNKGKIFFNPIYDNDNDKNMLEVYSKYSPLKLSGDDVEYKGEEIDNGYKYLIDPKDKTSFLFVDPLFNSASFKLDKKTKLTSYNECAVDEAKIFYKDDVEKSEVVGIDKNALKLTICSEYKDVDEDGKPYVGTDTRNFTPTLRFKVPALNNAKYLEFEYENTGSATLDFNVIFTIDGGTNKKYTYSHTSTAGKKKKVIIDLTKSKNDLATFNTIDLSFENYRTVNSKEVLCEDREMVLSNIYLRGAK